MVSSRKARSRFLRAFTLVYSLSAPVQSSSRLPKTLALRLPKSMSPTRRFIAYSRIWPEKALDFSKTEEESRFSSPSSLRTWIGFLEYLCDSMSA